MQPNEKIYVAGHRGLVGSALMRNLEAKGYSNIVTRTHAELDLTDQAAVHAFMQKETPDYVFLAAAKVGGIHANNTYPAEFIYTNLAIHTNIIHAACKANVERLLFLGSSCIYPRDCPQPIKEGYLLTGSLEATNRPYALAKIAGIEMCWSYNRQYGTRYLAAMPTNLYGPGDNYDLANSHVLPALIRKFHEAKINNSPTVSVWGSGMPKREFLCSDDMADACVFLMNLPDEKFNCLLGSDDSKNGKSEAPLIKFNRLLGSDKSINGNFEPPLINVGAGTDISIKELAQLVKQTTGYQGEIVFDTAKPDGAMRKLLDVERLHAMGWQASTQLSDGVNMAYRDFVAGYVNAKI
ncbi:MAG: GDP-L-fucose synthase [Gallionellaceae bacterium]|nr:GDP-L-fucose synthase [Gallionellaceae bacterium]